MQKITIFLASSNELRSERKKNEIEIYAKCKTWLNNGVCLHLDVWEDVSARMSLSGSQSEYNKFIKDAVFLFSSRIPKLGWTRLRNLKAHSANLTQLRSHLFLPISKLRQVALTNGLAKFKKKLNRLKHLSSNFNNSNYLWNEFNEEPDKLEVNGFTKIPKSEKTADAKTITQIAEKIYHIEKIDKAEFS